MVNKALVIAARAHEGQKRKDGVPFITHPVEVALELAREGASEETLAAALLHDVVEDTAVSHAEIAAEFPAEVAALVDFVSEQKGKSWDERKRHTIELLKNNAPLGGALITCADKLVNLRSIKKERERIGEDVWGMFSRPKEDQAWYYRAIGDALAPRLAGTRLYNEYLLALAEVFGEPDERANSEREGRRA